MLKAMVVCGGQETTMGLTVLGKVIVVTVGPVADTVVRNGVRKIPETVLSLGSIQGLVGLPQPDASGGPLETAGQGGRVTVRVVVLPSPLETGMPIGGMSTLGVKTIESLVRPEVTFTL